MRYKLDQGNAIIEFLIYVLVVATFTQILTDFYRVARSINEMHKVGNLITSTIAQNPKTIDKWSSDATKRLLWEKYDLSKIDYSVQCKPLGCSNNPESINLWISVRTSIMGIEIPISINKKAAVSRYLVYE
jgi:hypothetical protein